MSQVDPPSSKTGTCARCGAAMPRDAPRGNCPACLWELVAGTVEASAATESGHRRFGSYELLETIASGGMGVVYRARQDGLERDVALKMILAGNLATSAQVIRFYTEAKAAARLDHPNIVPIYDFGEDDGRHFYTMKLMEGRSLAEALQKGPRPSHEEAARLVADVARAVHFAHQRGILHRDLKPSNILLDAERKPHVADFGLARLGDEDSGASRSGSVVGTPAYMAPEQAAGRSREVTTAADVYSLGAVLYEILAGDPPFHANTPLETLRRVIETEAPSIRSREPRLDRDLDVVCTKCLQKRPEKRYGSAAELADDLERWLDGKPILARPVSALERIVSWARRKRELATAIAALFALLVAALVVTVALLIKVRGENEARTAALRSEEGQRLAFQSLAAARETPGLALLLALEAAARNRSLSSNSALLAALEARPERRRLLGHTNFIEHASFSPDGLRVVTAAFDETARIWSVETGETLQVLAGHKGFVNSAYFSNDGKRVVTAGNDGTARIWDAGTGRELTTISGHTSSLRSARFSPDGRTVLTVSHGSARIWDAASGAPIHVFNQHNDEVTCGKLSPGGERVITGSRDRTAKVWNAATGELLATLAGHTERVADVCFSGDGRRIATASVPEARVWDARTYEELAVCRGHAQDIYCVALTSDGARLATGSEDFSARIWDARSGAQLHLLPHDHKVASIDISRDDSLVLTASYDKVARVWDLESGELVAEMRGHAAPLVHASFSPSGQEVVTACVDFTARVWTVRPREPIALVGSGGVPVVDADIDRDGKSIVEAFQGNASVTVRDLESRRETARLEGHNDRILCVRFNPDGTRVVTASADRTARLWDPRGGEPLAVLAGHDGDVFKALFSPDGRRVLTFSHDGAARLWDADDGSPAAVYRSEAAVSHGSFAPDNDRLALTDDAWNLRLVRISSGEVQLCKRDDLFKVLDFSPGGTDVVVSAGTTRVRVEGIADGRTKGTLVHPARASFVAYSPDGRWIVTTASDGVARIWDGVTHEEQLEVRRIGWQPQYAHFPASGRQVLVTWLSERDRDRGRLQVVLYSLDVLAAAEAARFGELTPDERDLFQVGSVEERRQVRRTWKGGQVFGSTMSPEQAKAPLEPLGKYFEKEP